MCQQIHIQIAARMNFDGQRLWPRYGGISVFWQRQLVTPLFNWVVFDTILHCTTLLNYTWCSSVLVYISTLHCSID